MTALPPLTAMAWLRHDHIARHLRRCPDGARLLEIGTGQGALAVRLATRFAYTGVEQDEASAAVAGRRLAAVGRGRIVEGDEAALEDRAGFDLVCAFEVLEHLADDAAALRRWHSRLRPGGLLVLSVPAGSHRMGPWDRHVGHYRRYDRRRLQMLLEAAGFADVDIAVYGFPLGYLLEAVRNSVATRRGVTAVPEVATAASGRVLQPTGWFGALLRIGIWPFRLLQRPFARTNLGIGIVAAARPAHTISRGG